MNIFAFSSILVLVFSLLNAFIILLRSRSRQLGKVWAALSLVVSTWGLGGFIFATTQSREKAFLGWQIGYICCIFSPVLYYHFVYVFTKTRKQFDKLLLFSSYIFGFIYLLFTFFSRDIFLGGLRLVFNRFYWTDCVKVFNPLWLSYYIGFNWLLLLYSFILLILSYKKSSGVFRNQLKYSILGSVIGWIGAHGDYIIVFHIDIYPYANFLIAIYPLIFAYAIVKYRLMDVNIAITRTGIFIIVCSIVLGIPFVLIKWFYKLFLPVLGSAMWVVPLLGLMALLATVAPFIYIFLNRKAEQALLREQRRYQNVLKQAAIGMTRVRDLNKLLNLIVHIVTKTVRISHCAVYLFDRQSEQFIMKAGRNIKRKLPDVAKNTTLMVWLKEHPQPLVYEEIERRAQETPNLIYKEIEEQMRSLNAAVIIPSDLERNLLGFLILGEKLSKRIYTDSDLEVFFVLASQGALAIENAQFILEAKFVQEQIAHTEKMVTVGTMADGLSHQINNRFHALSLITEDTMDTIKAMDLSACSPEMQELFKQINYALSRIQANVQQGGEVVEGILKYTRKEGQEKEPLTLEQVINGTLDMLRYKIKLDEIDIVHEFSQDLPKISGNLVQLQEVFFNVMDNAYDSMMERKNSLHEEGYRGRIVISAEELNGNFLRITLNDNGMGIKKENQKKVFTPFFTTKISSHKGTGLGLYVIHRIIVDMHKGKVYFESEYKKGTRFFIDLPIAMETR